MASTVAALPRSETRRAWRPGRTIKGAAGILAFLALWQASVPLVGLEPYFYPAPADVWAASSL